MREEHTIAPVFDADAEILILGSFPSVKSREQGFFYGHPQNRFWRVLAAVFKAEVPLSIAEKKAFLLKNHVAVWDVIAACEITGSADSSIKNAVPNDLNTVLHTANITKIITNGKTADKLYRRYLEDKTQIPAICLPSTSPANAAWTLERLTARWKQELR